MFSNIWKHPRTSVTGILISVATIAGVLAQQGVTFGTLGGGSAVTLAGALATALLGLVARDPGQQPAPTAPACTGNCAPAQSGATGKLSVWLLILLLIPLPWLQGCTASAAAQDIVNWTPSLQSAIATVDSTAALLEPSDAPAFAAATAEFDSASNLLVVQARAYLANPSAATLAQLQGQVVALQQQVNSAFLSAARIVDPASQQHALAAIQAVATIVTAILALVQSVSSKAQVAQMAAHAPVKLAAVAPYVDASASAELIAAHYGESRQRAESQMAAAEMAEESAGF